MHEVGRVEKISKGIELSQYEISNMSKQDINKFITNHFGESRKKYVKSIIVLGVLQFISMSAIIYYVLYFDEINFIPIVFMLFPSFIGYPFVVVYYLVYSRDEDLIIAIIQDDSRSKLITKDTWEKIPKKFLERNGLM
jgi:hypothetical protein